MIKDVPQKTPIKTLDHLKHPHSWDHVLTSTQRRIPTAPHDVSHFERVSSPALTLRAFTRKSRANQRGATCLRQLLLGQRDGGHSLQVGKRVCSFV